MTQAATSEPATPQTRQKPTRVWRTSFAALIGAIVITMFALWLQPPPSQFELITDNDYEHRTKRFAFIRDARAWMTRFSPTIFGFAPVEICASYRETGLRGATDLTALARPAFSTNAVRVWILASNEVARIARDLSSRSTARWRITSSEGIPSAMSTGTPTGAGIGSMTFANHPKIRGGDVDLAAKFTAILANREPDAAARQRTNQIAFRIFLKPDEGGIVFDGDGVLFLWAHSP